MIINLSKKFAPLFILFLFLNFSFAQKQYSRDNFPRDNFPSGNEVLAKVKGDNEKETILKQIRVFSFLSSEINTALLYRKQSPKEKILVDGYDRVSIILKNKYDKEIASLDNKHNKDEYYDALNSKIWEAEIFTINNLFDENTKKYYEAELQRATRLDAAEQHKTEYKKESSSSIDSKSIETIFLIIVGLIFFLGIPFVILSFRARRRFNRTNKYGVEEHASFGQALSNNIFDKFLGFLVLISIIIGVSILFSAFT